MRIRIISNWRQATVSLFFVFLFLSLPAIDKNFQILRLSETFGAEFRNQDDSAQNQEGINFNDSTGNKEQNVACFRLIRDGKTPVRLETAIMSFQGYFPISDGSTRPVTVDLIGAIHFAESDYYDRLNRIFQEYDVVVFEMVAPEGADFKELIQKEQQDEKSEGKSILNIVPFVQKTLADALNFTYQIDGVNYCAANLKRGDADVEEFLIQLISNIDLPSLCLPTLVSLFTNESSGKATGLALVLLCAKNKRLAARRLLAVELENSGAGEFITDDSEKTTELTSPEDDAVIAFRNQKALDVVRKELKNGRSKIAIFYGAAHLTDFAQRLERDFGLKQTSETRWIPSWNLEK